MHTQIDFRIRPVEKEEVDILYHLICELAEYEGKDISKLPLKRENLSHYGFGNPPLFHADFVEEDEQIVGYALYYYGFSASLGHPILYLEDIYVKPEYRRKGHGSELIKHLAQIALKQGCKRINWLVFSWNDAALNFYKKVGATINKGSIPVHLCEKEILSLAKT